MTEVPQASHPVLARLLADPDAPVQAVVLGGIGTGKSTTLAAIRDALRDAGIVAVNRPPRDDGLPRAVIVDDAHELSDTDLAVLAGLTGDPSITLVVASEPRTRPALRSLITALEREQPRISLGPLPRSEVGRRVAGATGLDTVMSATAGLPFLLRPILDSAAALGDTQSANRVVRAALSTRLRGYDEPTLAALLMLSLDSGLGPTDVATALGTDPDAARDLIDICYASGLLDPAHGRGFTMTVHRAAEQVLGGVRHREIETALLCSQEEAAVLSTPLAITLAEHGMRHPTLAAVLEKRATGDPQSVRLLRAALMASEEQEPRSDALAIRLADAAVRIGDCETAAALADGLLEAGDPAHRAAAVRIAASVATHDGNTGQAAELYRWLGQFPDYRPTELDRAAGTVVFLAAGDPDAARELLRVTGAGPPTSAARGSRYLAEGLMSTLDQAYPVAAARLGQVIGTARNTTPVLPDSMPALVALAALHAGDPTRARSILGRTESSDVLFGHRHRLLLAWAQMQDGQLQSAASVVTQESAGADRHRRDALWTAALRTAIARRGGDTGALQRHWAAALDVLAEYSVDLFSLLPIGELWVAAARLRQTDRLTQILDQAFAVIAALGDPPAWSLPLHWAGVHAAILANTPEAMATHGQALSAAADGSGFAGALAAGGRAWLRVLARQVDAGEIDAAARGLSRFGLSWDATRLAGQAALQTPDPKVSAVMLQLARELKLAAGATEPVDTGDADIPGSAHRTPVPGRSSARGGLSDREREVAELLLLGMPYRDIGARLFISAKTVEHHVARIRRRLGAESRSELLSMLRVMLIPVSRST